MITPIYKELSKKLESYVKTLPPGSKLPGTAKMAADFGVNQRTVIKAMHLIADKGMFEWHGTRAARLKPARKKYFTLAMVGCSSESYGRNLLQQLNELTVPNGWKTIFISFNDALFAENPGFILNFPIDGYLFFNSALRLEILRILEREKIPFVSASIPAIEGIDVADCDHAKGYPMLLQYLRTLGHRRIAWIGTEISHEYRHFVDEIKGYFKDALGEEYSDDLFYLGRPESELLAKYGADYITVFLKNVIPYFSRLRNPPTAIISGKYSPFVESLSDFTYALVCYKDLFPVKNTIRLTYDQSEIVKWCCKRLLRRVKGEELPAEKFLLEPELFAADSKKINQKEMI